MISWLQDSYCKWITIQIGSDVRHTLPSTTQISLKANWFWHNFPRDNLMAESAISFEQTHLVGHCATYRIPLFGVFMNLTKLATLTSENITYSTWLVKKHYFIGTLKSQTYKQHKKESIRLKRQRRNLLLEYVVYCFHVVKPPIPLLSICPWEVWYVLSRSYLRGRLRPVLVLLGGGDQT